MGAVDRRQTRRTKLAKPTREGAIYDGLSILTPILGYAPMRTPSRGRTCVITHLRDFPEDFDEIQSELMLWDRIIVEQLTMTRQSALQTFPLLTCLFWGPYYNRQSPIIDSTPPQGVQPSQTTATSHLAPRCSASLPFDPRETVTYHMSHNNEPIILTPQRRIRRY